jgi:hypothetical protein
MSIPRRPLITLLVLACVIAAPNVARADGDPASDTLYTDYIFFPYTGSISPASKDRLRLTVKTARQAGYTIKVALIGDRADLGAVPTLFGKPQQYAHFLGLELALLYKGPLLTVMPNGFGIFHFRKPVTREMQTLSRVPIGKGLSGMADSASLAIRRLAADSGHTVPAVTVPPTVATVPTPLPEPPKAPGSFPTDWVLIITPIAVLVIALLLGALVYRQRTRSRQQQPRR